MQNAAYGLNADELVHIIQRSALPEEKKLAFLYCMASGNFTNLHLKELSESLHTAEKTQKEKISGMKSNLKSLKEEIKVGEAKIDALTPKAKEDFQHALNQIVALATAESIKKSK